MKKRLLALITTILVGILLAVGLSLAEEIVTQKALWWDSPSFETANYKIESDQPITAVFSGTFQVRRVTTGEIVYEQNFGTACQPQMDQPPGTGQCGAVDDFVIDTDDFQQEDLELWSRACWAVTGYDLLCSIYVPPGCHLTEAGCTILLEGGAVTIPKTCRSAIEQCGTVQDDQGYWRIRTFRGTKRYGICIPGLMMIREE